MTIDRRKFLRNSACTIVALTLGQYKDVFAQKQKRQKEEKKPIKIDTGLKELSETIILGRPTDSSVTLYALAHTAATAWVMYDIQADKLAKKSDQIKVTKDETLMVTITGLPKDTTCHYQICWTESGKEEVYKSDIGRFHTQRKDESEFTFAIHADPHMDHNSNVNTYTKTMANTLADKPDFLIDLGDTSMTGKLSKTRERAVERHMLLRHFFEKTCHSVPLFLVIGNHDGEDMSKIKNSPDCMSVWSTHARMHLFPNPVPNEFYTGDNTDYKYVGVRTGYYAWKWGAAHFIVLDPYWFSTKAKKGDTSGNWGVTLGKKQYDWLTEELTQSKSPFKFVFCHYLVGGFPKDDRGTNRGGIEAAHLFEWGGHNPDGTYEFDKKRPGWGKPIHQLLVENGVSVFFHGHDHFYGKQNLDGIVYQEVPQPSHAGYTKINTAREYGYVKGTIIANSGHLRIKVNPKEAHVEYVRAFDREDSSKGWKNGSVADSYTLKPAKNGSPVKKSSGKIKKG